MAKGFRAERSRGSVLVFYAFLLPTLLMFIGLAVDLGILYVVQTRLSSAVDGAALGAGRLLGTSADTNEIATEFLNAGFPVGYWGSYNLVPAVSSTNNASLHTIAVSASVQVPLMFLRILQQQNCTVRAASTAVRRDVRIELVLDRSYSMNAQMANLRSAASNFVSMFSPGTDQMGLVVYGGSGFVAYPTSEMPNYSLTTGTGPDVHFADPVSGGSQNMVTTINNLQVGTDTNTAEGIWLAYKELQKAVAIDSDTTKANVIVLFTDGIPNGFTAYLNDPAHNALSNSSNCYYNPATGSANQMIGWLATTGGGAGLAFFSPTASTGIGFYKPLIFDKANSGYYWATHISGSYVDDMNQVTGTPMTNCQHIGAGSSGEMSGLAKIPPQDYYGNSSNGTAYNQGVLYNKYNIGYDSTKPTNGYHMGLASWNVTDNAAQRILSDSAMNVAIYAIGFTGNGGVDAALLKRMANTQDSSSYSSTNQTGLYVEAADAAEMQQAFGQVASEVLRLAK